MPHFLTTFITADGRTHREVHEAESITGLYSFIRGRGDFPVTAKTVKPRLPKSRRLKLRPQHTAVLFDLLSTLLGSGVRMEKALESLKQTFHDRSTRIVLTEIHTALSESKTSLSDAFALFPRTFSSGMVMTIAAGQEQGAEMLAARFADLRDQILFSQAIKEARTKALAYPLFIFCYSVVMILILLIKLVPQLTELLATFNAKLPATTRSVIKMSAFAQEHWFHALIAGFVVAVIWQLSRRHDRCAQQIDAVLLRLPWLGNIHRSLIIAEISKNYGALYVSGKSTAQNFAACAAIVTNRAVRAALLRAKLMVETGAFAIKNHELLIVTEAFAATGYFPPLALTIIRAGEQTANLSKSFGKVADHYSANAKKQADRFFAVFEKVVMLLIAAFCAYIIISIFHPLFEAIRSVK